MVVERSTKPNSQTDRTTNRVNIRTGKLTEQVKERERVNKQKRQKCRNAANRNFRLGSAEHSPVLKMDDSPIIWNHRTTNPRVAAIPAGNCARAKIYLFISEPNSRTGFSLLKMLKSCLISGELPFKGKAVTYLNKKEQRSML